MKRTRCTKTQIIAFLKELEGGLFVTELSRKHGVGEATMLAIYIWRRG
jgi:hypothetical protein